MKKQELEQTKDILIIILNNLLLIAGVITILDLFQVQNSYFFLGIVLIMLPFFLYKVGIIGKPKLLPPPCMIIGFEILSMLEKTQGIYDREVYYLILTGSYLIGYFIFFFIKQYMEFIGLNEKSAGNKAEEEIFQNGIRQTFIYCIGSAFIFMIAVSLDWLSKIVNRMADGLLIMLRHIFSKINTTVPEEVPQNVMQNMTSESNGGGGEAMHLELSDTFLKSIVLIFSIAAVIAFFILAYLIYKYYRVHIQFLKKAKNEKELQVTGDIREKCKVKQKKKEKTESWFGFFNNREKVRKLYRKKILSEKKKLVGEQEQGRLEYLTPKECCSQLNEENLQMLYEKARYSEKEIRREEVRRL